MQTESRAYRTEFAKILSSYELGKWLTPSVQKQLLEDLVSASLTIAHAGKPGTAGAIAAYAEGHESLADALRDHCGITPNWRAKTNADLLHTLRERGATPDNVETFMAWWRTNWRGKDGNPPSLAQVVEFWHAALVSGNNEAPKAETMARYEAETVETMRILSGA